MANQEKQHKKGFMYIYKIGTGNQRKKELEHGVEKEKKLSSSRSWLQRIRNPMTRSYNHKELNINGGFVEARNSTSCLELESRGGYIEGRNSVSCIEASSSPAITRGIIVEEGRKSVSYVETKLAAEDKLDMPSFMQVNAFRCARKTYDSLEEFSSKHIAHNIKKN
ncbi:hypothetical protein TSUD_194500 [Trifolium subterraneum]|uniref:Uncharacterized protein n=1 Tax=Trifolium subterraneum TaxID=3900 RepID=A0A2Z6NGZ1_TRISU|nr:hypothetical protein TSUD_194500 [Trifolium subterraneum]